MALLKGFARPLFVIRVAYDCRIICKSCLLEVGLWVRPCSIDRRPLIYPFLHVGISEFLDREFLALSDEVRIESPSQWRRRRWEIFLAMLKHTWAYRPARRGPRVSSFSEENFIIAKITCKVGGTRCVCDDKALWKMVSVWTRLVTTCSHHHHHYNHRHWRQSRPPLLLLLLPPLFFVDGLGVILW